jgi:hypothetical protein
MEAKRVVVTFLADKTGLAININGDVANPA